MTLKFIICGLEHTGTTLISELFRQVPGLDSGFECGVLLRDAPAKFRDLQPFARQMIAGWGITQAQLDHCCEAETMDEFYGRLLHESTVLNADTTSLFDKTPRYLQSLAAVMERVDVPVLVSYKDPRAIVCSDFKRAKTDDFDTWYESYYPKKRRYVETCFDQFTRLRSSPRVTTIALEDLAMNARSTMEGMFEHVGETFKLDYAVFDTVRYRNVRNRTVSEKIAFEYREVLPARARKRIESDFKEFDAWFYA